MIFKENYKVVSFLGFIVFINGVQDDQSKIFVIIEWLTPMSIHDVWIFHRLASFYKKSI
jgi:hypothetical protein